MINPDKMFGRLGNRLFQMAALIEYAYKNDTNIYFQDEKWFKDSKEQVIKLFSEGIGYLSQTAIHVRRGSNPINPEEPKYSENPFYVDLTKTDYYERAIALFPNDNFLVFSDDPTWCKEKWGNNSRFQIMEGGNEIDDLNMMASCQNLIIANSSYSWWAAYLCPNPAHRVIAPKMWYSDNVERTILPSDWEVI